MFEQSEFGPLAVGASMESPVVLLGLVIVTLVSIVACHLSARSRGGNGVYWGVMGLLFGPFAIPFARFAKPKWPTPADRSDSDDRAGRCWRGSA